MTRLLAVLTATLVTGLWAGEATVRLNNDAVYEEGLKKLQANPPAPEAPLEERLRHQMMLAQAESKLRRYDKAEAIMRELVKLYPTWDYPHLSLSVDLGKQGKFKEAEAEARRAIALNPTNSLNAVLALASWLWHQDKKDEAMTLIKAAPDVTPENKQYRMIHGCLACFYASVGDEQQIENHMEKALKSGTAPDNADFFKRDVCFDPYRGKAWFIKLVGKTLAE